VFLHKFDDGQRIGVGDEDVGPTAQIDRFCTPIQPVGWRRERCQNAFLSVLHVGKPGPELPGAGGDVRVGQHDPLARPRRSFRVDECPTSSQEALFPTGVPGWFSRNGGIRISPAPARS